MSIGPNTPNTILGNTIFYLGEQARWDEEAQEYWRKQGKTVTDVKGDNYDVFSDTYKQMRTMQTYGNQEWIAKAIGDEIDITSPNTARQGLYNNNLARRAAMLLPPNASSDDVLDAAKRLFDGVDPNDPTKPLLIKDADNDDRVLFPPEHRGDLLYNTIPQHSNAAHSSYLTTAEVNAVYYDSLPDFWKNGSNWQALSSDSFAAFDCLDWNVGLQNNEADPNGCGKWTVTSALGNAPICNHTVAIDDINNNDMIASIWQQTACFNDPILLDLDNDGIELVSTEDGIYFDNNADGFAENTAFVNTEDGVLVLDRNQNGFIDDGSEFFGDQTLLANEQKATDGYQALAELDTNIDGVIDINDTEFANLKVMKGDGTLETLTEAGIKSLNLTHTADNTTDTEGNTRLSIGSFTRIDDTTSEMSEFSLSRNLMNSLATEWLDVPEDIAELPEIQGTGNTYWLSQAMVRDTSGELKALVQQFVDEENPTTRDSLLEQILYKWTNSDNVDPTSRGDFDAQKLAVIESFMGEYFQNSATSIPDAEDISSLENIYNTLKEQVYAQLMRQSHLSYMYDISFSYDAVNNVWNFNLEGAIGELQYEISQDKEAGKLMLREFTRTLTGLGLFNNAAASTFYNSFYYLGDEYRYAMDTATNLIIYGTDNADSLVGTDKNDAFYGLDGNDSIVAGAGNDYLDGGAGNDTLLGGDGNDLISSGAGNNYIESNYLEGNAGDDTLIGSGGDGNDLISSGAGNNYIESNYLEGNAGDDTLIGSGGDDVLFTKTLKFAA